MRVQRRASIRLEDWAAANKEKQEKEDNEEKEEQVADVVAERLDMERRMDTISAVVTSSWRPTTAAKKSTKASSSDAIVPT